MKSPKLKKWCMVVVLGLVFTLAERGFSQLLIRTTTVKTTSSVATAVSTYDPFLKTAVQEPAPIQDTQDTLSLIGSSSFTSKTLLSLRPPIRVPYRPPLRSPYKPPL